MSGRAAIPHASRKGPLPSPPGSDALLQQLYKDLRGLAAARMAREHSNQTLQPTALVHEAWLRMGGQEFKNQAHFFGSAAEAMRRILVERARHYGRQKRGGGWERSDYEESRIASPVEEDKLLEVHEALNLLEQEDSRKAAIVKLRFFAGLTHAEIGALLDMSEKTVRRHWHVAKIRLFQILKDA